MATNGTRKSIRMPNPTLADSVFKMFDMHNKVAIITGGSGGIGHEVARGLAEAGADVR
jgi:sorbose reductase